MISITISLLWVIACLFWFYYQDRKRIPTDVDSDHHQKTKVRDPVRRDQVRRDQVEQDLEKNLQVQSLSDEIEIDQEIDYSIFKP